MGGQVRMGLVIGGQGRPAQLVSVDLQHHGEDCPQDNSQYSVRGTSQVQQH